MKSRRRRADNGITLLEVLLALAIMGMIGVALGSMFQTGGQVWARVDGNRDFPDQALARFDLRRDLENMPIVTALVPIDQLFRVEPDGFSFAHDLDDDGGQAHWIGVTSNNEMVQTRKDGEGQKYVLRTDLSRSMISYYGSKLPRDIPAWHDNWDGAIILPKLIKIETWNADGTANPPFAAQPGIVARQSEISLSSLIPPD